MKKYSIFLSATLVLFALASCQKEAETNVPEVQKGFIPFELKADIDDSAGMTKTSLNPSTKAVNWVDGDIIYAVTTDKLWGQDYKDDNSGATIAEFTYDESTDKFTTTSEIAAGAHTFNFLYSNGAQKSYHRGSSTTFQLYSNQTYDVSNPCANIKAYDALAAQLTVTTPATLTGITMKHLFTLMKVTIKNKTGADVNVTKFELIAKTGTYLYGVFDVTFGATPTVAYNKNGGTTIATVISNGTIANNGTIDIYFVMAPLTSYTGDITFRVTDDADNTYSRTNTISSALTLAAGSLNSATHTLTAADATDDYSGDYLIGAKPSSTWNLMSSTNGGQYYSNQATSVSKDFGALVYTDFSSELDTDDYIWTVSKTSNGYSIKSKKTGKYVSFSGSTSGRAFAADALDDTNLYTYFNIIKDGGTNVSTITSKFSSGYALQFNSSSPRFACYSSNQTSLYLIPATADTRTSVTLSFADPTPSYTTTTYTGFTGQAVTSDPNESAITDNITYAKTSDENSIITSLNTSTGAVTLSGNTGSATITATFDGDASYKPASASYTITVTSGAASWTRVTSVATLLAGGTFIIGYEATANSGVIVPMANSGSATTSAAGFMYSGSEASSGGTGTIDMSSVSVTSNYEVTIGASSEVSGAIYIKIGANYLGNTNTKNNCKLFTEEATTTSFTPTIGENNTFTLDIAENTSGNAYRYLKYNTGSPRFAVYSTAPEKIVIYKKN